MKQATVKLPSGEFLIAEADNYGNTQSFLFPGSWQLLGADPTNLTEKEARTIVGDSERVNTSEDDWVMGYPCYTGEYSCYLTAVESLDSLAASLGIEKPFVVLKNIEK